MLLYVVYERSLKLDCNQNFYLNTNFNETLLLKNRPNYSKSTGILISSSEEVVAGEILSVGIFWDKVSYSTDWMVTEKGFENGEKEKKCAKED